MNNKSNGSKGLSFCGVLTIVFIVLKLVKVIDWSWWWVLSPLWIDLGLCILFALGFYFYFRHEDKELGTRNRRRRDKWKF